MKRLNTLILLSPIILVMFLFTSCDMEENPVGTFGEAVKNVWDFELIPGADNVDARVTKNSETSYFNFEISGVENDLFMRPGIYSAWCALYNTPIDANGGEYGGVKLYSTQGDKYWNTLNYLLNNKYKYINDSFGATWKEVQVAIWAVIDFPRFDIDNINVGNLASDFRDGNQITFDLSIAKMIYQDAKAYGPNYQYSIGDTYAIFVETANDVQNGILEGCTPGFWRQSQWLQFWTDYSPTDKFSDSNIFDRVITVFTSSSPPPPPAPSDVNDPTLLQAVWAAGGGINALARHAVAALLNAASPNVNYLYSVQQVISMTQAAIDGNADIEETKDLFDAANNAGCPLGADPGEVD
jgi:hypothetical protein